MNKCKIKYFESAVNFCYQCGEWSCIYSFVVMLAGKHTKQNTNKQIQVAFVSSRWCFLNANFYTCHIKTFSWLMGLTMIAASAGSLWKPSHCHWTLGELNKLRRCKKTETHLCCCDSVCTWSLITLMKVLNMRLLEIFQWLKFYLLSFWLCKITVLTNDTFAFINTLFWLRCILM